LVDARVRLIWCNAGYEAAGVVARIGQHSAALDLLLHSMDVREAIFVGAWNPRGRKVALGINLRMEARLVEFAARPPARRGKGFGPGWSESHLLLGVRKRRGIVIARRFRQAAIVMVRRGQPPKLIFIPV